MKVIAGTGQLGMAILDILLENDATAEILLVNRSGKINRPLPANTRIIAADVTDKYVMENIARDAAVIYSCTDVPYQQWDRFYPAVAGALAYALQKTNTKIVFADNMYSYGNTAGQMMHEMLPHTAQTKKGKIRAAVIEKLLQPNNSGRVAIVKAADFIGPGIHKGVLGTDFLNRLYSGKTIYLFGNTALLHTYTYIGDFARAMVNVGGGTCEGTWHVPNAAPISTRQWIALFEKETGKKARIQTMPKFVVRLTGLFSPLIAELYELAYQFEYPYLVSHAQYEKRFGNHSTGHAAAVRQTVDWYVKNKGAAQY